MIISTLISQARREFQDIKKSTRVARQGDGTSNTFNLGVFPIVEGSYTVKLSGFAQTENVSSGYTLDKDNGDLVMGTTPGAGKNVEASFQHAHWRDQNWIEAISQGVDKLNSKGFRRRVVRDGSVFGISANVKIYSGPSACTQVFGIFESDDYTTNGNYVKLRTNWDYQREANKIVFKDKPTRANVAELSYLRLIQKPTVSGSVLDTNDEWNEVVKKYAGAMFYRSLAAKKAQDGGSQISGRRFQFSELNTMANNLLNEFEQYVKENKPTGPSIDIQFNT